MLPRAVEGSFHQGSLGPLGLSRSFGTQCTAIALVSLIFAGFHLQPHQWGTEQLDEIVLQGDRLYQAIVVDRFHGDMSTFLGHDDLPRNTHIFNDIYEVDVDNSIAGVVSSGSMDPSTIAFSVHDAIQVAEALSNYMLCTFNDATIAVIHNDYGYYIFDSHARNSQGAPDPDGSSVLLHFVQYEDFIQYIRRTYNSYIFNISPCCLNVHSRARSSVQSLPPSLEQGNVTYRESKFNNGNQILRQTSIDTEQFNNIDTSLNVGNENRVYQVFTESKSHNNHTYTCSEGFKPKKGKSRKPSQTISCTQTNVSTTNVPNTDVNATNVLVTQNVFSDELIPNIGYDCVVHSEPFQSETCVTESSTGFLQGVAYQHQDQFQQSPMIDNTAQVSPHANSGLGNHTYNKSERTKDKCTSVVQNRKRQQNKNGVSPAEIACQAYSISDIPMLDTDEIIQDVCYNCVVEYSVFDSSTPVQSENGNDDIMHNSLGNTQLNDYDPSQVHDISYEQYIKLQATNSCQSCHRFLFPNQIYKVSQSKLNNFTVLLDITNKSCLCQTCKKYLLMEKIPPICYKLNCLDVGCIPVVLSQLSKLEKKLISTIQVFLTMVILPGGQYAEKGLVLNMPVNINTTLQEIGKIANLNNICVVNFAHNSPVGQIVNYFIDPLKVVHAITWLKMHNHLYLDVILPLSLTNINRFEGDDLQERLHTIEQLENVTMADVNYTVPIDNRPTHISTNTSDRNILEKLTLHRSTSEPVSVYEIPYGEERAFPWLYPQGKHGFTFPRPIKITPSMYFKSRLYNKEGTWRLDPTYLLHAAVSYDTLVLKQEIGIYLKMHKHSTQGNCSENTVPVTIADIRNPSHNNSIMYNSYMFMRHIRGTVAYFKNALFDLLAMFKNLGPPTIFMTLSADDLHWPELGMFLENISYEEAVQKGSFFESLRKDPLKTAIHFERRFSALMKHVILGTLKPLGQIKDHFVRVEFQNRGSPHYHIFFWIDNCPPFDSSDHNSHAKVCQYLNNTICTELPDEGVDKELYDLVQHLQRHSHTKYCQPSARSPCRFRFPKRECSFTHILSREHIKRNKGKFYETKRSQNALFINAYNPTILRHWRANMDIQVINNAEGAAYYVCHYLCKAEPDDLRGALHNLIHNVLNQNLQMSSFQRLWNIGTCVLKHRRMSAQEAAFRLSNLKLIQMSRVVVYLNTRPENKRFKMLKPKILLDQLPEDSTDIFQTNLVDYYQSRPSNLEHMSLFNFAAWYVRCPKPNKLRSGSLDRIYINKYDIWMRKRSHAAIVRYPSSSVQSEQYYYSLLMLLLPFRQESELLQNYTSPRSAFLNNYSRLNLTLQSHEHFVHELENSIRRIQHAEAELNAPHFPDAQESEYTADNLNAHWSQEENATMSMSFLPVQSTQAVQHDNITHLETTEMHFHELMACSMSEHEFNLSCATLTTCQKKVLCYVKSFYMSQNGNRKMKLFITGGGGVGKSFIIKIIVAFLQLKTSIFSAINPVLLCAPTGTAAHNIHGYTIHSLLKIPVSKYVNYASLSPYEINQLRNRFRGVHTLIIDEISMVSDTMLTIIHRRLSEISNNDSPFGGFNIIAVGDFFQLRPVRASFAFQNIPLWHLFVPIFLRTNVRQISDVHYAQLLNRARVGLLQPDDVNDLKSRLVTPSSDAITKTLHIFPTRAAVKKHNLLCESILIGEKFIIDAEHYFSPTDTHPGAEVPLHLIPEDDRDAGGLPNRLHITVGSRVMLIRNICTHKGLVNGAMGTVASVVFNTHTSAASGIRILFDDRAVGSTNNNQNDNHSPILIEQIEFQFVMQGRQIIRRSFPLILCWACTIHKVQGMTLSEANVDIGSGIFEHGMAYVALSRVQSLNRLALSAFNPSVITPSMSVLEEYNRLRGIEPNNLNYS